MSFTAYIDNILTTAFNDNVADSMYLKIEQYMKVGKPLKDAVKLTIIELLSTVNSNSKPKVIKTVNSNNIVVKCEGLTKNGNKCNNNAKVTIGGKKMCARHSGVPVQSSAPVINTQPNVETQYPIVFDNFVAKNTIADANTEQII